MPEKKQYYQPVDPPQDKLFTETEEWRKEWVGMPEFEQGKQEEFACIIVRFASQEDLDDFSQRIGQALTKKTKHIWHPKLIRGLYGAGKRYVDES